MSVFLKLSDYPVKNYTSILIVITLLLIGYYLFWYVDRSYENYQSSQQALMQQSTMKQEALRLVGPR